MKTLIFLELLFLSFSINGFSQEKALRLYNATTFKEITIKENKRIRIKTLDGVKHRGRFQIIDEQTIHIDGQNILLSDIEKIKRNPLLVAFVSDVILVYFGAAALGVGILIFALSGETAALLLTLPGAAMIYSGFVSPNFLKAYKTDKNWNYSIINLSK